MRYVIAVNDSTKFVTRGVIGIDFSSDIEDAILYQEEDTARGLAAMLTSRFTVIYNTSVLPVRLIPQEEVHDVQNKK